MVRLTLEIAFFFLFALAMRRLLGVRHLSAPRTIAATLVGVSAGELLRALLVRRGLEPDLATTTGLVLAVLFAMVTTLTLEVVSGNPSRRTARPRHVLDGARRRMRQGRRSIELASIASRHGLARGFGLAGAAEVDPTRARAYGADLRAALEEAGGVFVKLGQLLATNTDLVPAGVAAELVALQQDVTPVSRSELEPVLESAFGHRLEHVFASFSWEPLGAASIGQVHRAQLLSGEDVVVKVRRPEVSATIERDLQIALDLAHVVHERSARARGMDVVRVAEQFASQLRAELDYRIEATNTHEAHAAVPTGTPIEIPRVIDSMSSTGVLVMTHVPGTPLGRMGEVEPQVGARLAEALFRFQITTMLRGQRFHADPHPGNVLLTPDGRLGLIDFGSAGRLDALERASIGDVLTALALDDPTALRAALLGVGMDPDTVDPARLDRALARLMADHLGPGGTPSAELVRDLMAVAAEFELPIPPSTTQMLRALATLQGTVELLAPGFAIVDAAREIAAEDLRRDLRPENLAEEAKREAITLAPLLRRVPHHLDRIADQVEGGRVTVRIRLFADEHDVRVLSQLVGRVVLVAVGAALGVVSALMLGIDTDPALIGDLGLYDLLGFVGLFAGATLLMRVVLQVLRDP